MFNILLKKIMESSIDFPKQDLDLSIWEKDKEDKYKLREDVKEKILGTLLSYGDLNLEDIAEEIHITGSIGTTQYDKNTDIDVHIISNIDKLPKTKTPEQWQKDIKKHFQTEIEYIGTHPIEVYLQLNPDQELLSDALYDIESGVWVKGPLILPETFNPYEVYKHVLDRVAELSKEADIEFGEIKRDIIDFETIEKAMKFLPKPQKEKLKVELDKKLKEIEEDIENLMKVKKKYVDMRKQSSKPTSPEQAMTDLKLVNSWKDANATFKFLNRYGYLKVLSELEKMLEDDKIDSIEIDTLKHMFKV